MNRMKLIFIVLLLFLITIIVFFFVDNKLFKDSDSNNEIINEKEKEEIIEDITNDINEDYSEEEKEIAEEDKGYDQYLVANGYSGASDNVYYTKDGSLYHLVLSTKEIIKVAEGISKIEYGKSTILVYKDSDFKKIVEDSYLTYMD